MPLSPPTLAAVTRYWAGFFGCPAATFKVPGVYVLPHAELEEYRGIYCLQREAVTLVSVPPGQIGYWRARLAPLGADALTDAPAVARQLGVSPAQVIGPAALAYASALRPLPTAGTRLLTALDEEAHAALKAACGPLEWAHGGSEFELLPLAGRFVRGKLVALAGYEPWGEQIAHIAIVTHPAHRGHGYGAEAVSLLAETAIARGMIAQYRTLYANTPSLRLGASLGLVPFAKSLAIRLGP
ncbi:MAG: GNAT family N-acetyltransferase [Chloroflexales bacterium]|nr:GNAT family N-acetyltransferase [Chloroflexales bacterium]